MTADNYRKTQYNMPWIEKRADPYVYKHTDGYYYFTGSVPSYDKIVLRRSKTLKDLKDAKEKTLWERHTQGVMSVHIWAPEIHYIQGQWVIYFAGGDIDDIWAIRPYALGCKGDDPMNDEWEELGPVQGKDSFSFQDFSLDMTVFRHRNKWYCVWAEKVNVGKKISNLYISELETPVKLGSEQVLLSSPDYPWERVDFWVNEGPSLLKGVDRLFLTYSASATGSCYCMGMLSIAENADLLDPREWKKEKAPVLATDESKGLFGPGHNSFTKSEDGNSDIMIYHARQYDEIIGDPLYDHNRHAYCMDVVWSATGEPVFQLESTFLP